MSTMSHAPPMAADMPSASAVAAAAAAAAEQHQAVGGQPQQRMHSFLVNSVSFIVDAHFTPVKPVGTGAYGVVCSAIDRRTNERVAIKKITRAFDDLVDSKRILREIKLLRHFQHDNIVGLRDLVNPAPGLPFEDVYMVLDFMETDLHKIIYSRNRLTDEHVQYFVYQILKALKYIHSAKVIHRDLKPSNVLLNGNCDLKICDFGLARGVSDDENYELTEYVVTRWYRAPEVMCSCQEYDEKIDMWSVGCIMAELLGRKPLFPGDDYIAQMNLIFAVLGTPSEEDMEFITNQKALDYIRGLRPRPPVPLAEYYRNANPLALDLLSRMLTFDPRKRISVEEALAHPYLRGLHNVALEVECPVPFDFAFEKITMTKPVLQSFMMEEICKFRPELVSSPTVAPFLQACARFYQQIRDEQYQRRIAGRGAAGNDEDDDEDDEDDEEEEDDDDEEEEEDDDEGDDDDDDDAAGSMILDSPQHARPARRR